MSKRMAFGHDQFVHHEQGSKVVNYLASPAINGLSRRAFAQADSVLWGDSFVSCHMHGYRAGKSTLSKSQYNQLIFHNSFRIHLRVIHIPSRLAEARWPWNHTTPRGSTFSFLFNFVVVMECIYVDTFHRSLRSSAQPRKPMIRVR